MTENALYKQVMSLPDLIREQTWRLEDELRKVVPTRVQHGIRQIILTGSGDSAIAGVAAEHLFRTLVGVPTIAQPAMEVSRYVLDAYAGQYPYTPFVFATSNSGEVARVVEAARRARDVGGYVVGLTGDDQSRLAQTSDCTVDIAPPQFPPSPGMRSYVMAVLALDLFAIRLAEVRGRMTMDEAQAMRAELADVGDAVASAIESADAPLREFAQRVKDVQGVEFLASGPTKSSAAFGTAKVLEATGKQAAFIDTEEFVHLNYFEREAESIATLLLVPEGSKARSRAVEVAGLLTNLRRPWIALGSVPNAPASVALPKVRESFAPLVDAAVVGLFAAHLQDATGEVEGRGAVGQWADCVGGQTTRNSEIIY